MAQQGFPSCDLSPYPPKARNLAEANGKLLGLLPVVFRVILLREILSYDWKFPAERRELEEQLRLLAGLSESELTLCVQGFAGIKLNASIERLDGWADPAGFMEQLTDWLWSSGQMERFRAAAQAFAAFASAAKTPDPPPEARLGIVVIGQGAQKSDAPLFRKLRAHGVYFDNIKPEGGLETLLEAAHQRSLAHGTLGQAQSSRYKHWYIDGDVARPSLFDVQLSYAQLQQPRGLLLERIQQVIASQSAGPESLRSLLAKMRPEEIGLGGGMDPVLGHFAMSLLTEGSGTQVFSTTFVQWAARECLRRAQPETLLLRYAPRQQLRPMNVMLSQAKPGPPDPQGSLVDADMGAYYTWLNMSRLPGADRMRFLAWFEGHSEAIAVGPGLPAGASSRNPLDMRQLLAMLS
ncbi:MAG TPA: hypothetical protein VNW54_11300 [Granulicella sp.]|jgi:hypothetical protein|nr:hypothetical protein [Granulicella sp.]